MTNFVKSGGWVVIFVPRSCAERIPARHLETIQWFKLANYNYKE